MWKWMFLDLICIAIFIDVFFCAENCMVFLPLTFYHTGSRTYPEKDRV